jgi:hypothetical protein
MLSKRYCCTDALAKIAALSRIKQMKSPDGIANLGEANTPEKLLVAENTDAGSSINSLRKIKHQVVALQAILFAHNMQTRNRRGKEVAGKGLELEKIKINIPQSLDQISSINEEIYTIQRKQPLDLSEVDKLIELVKQAELAFEDYLSLVADLDNTVANRRELATKAAEGLFATIGLATPEEVDERFQDLLRKKADLRKRHSLGNVAKKIWLKLTNKSVVEEYEKLENQIKDVLEVTRQYREITKKYLDGTQIYFSQPVLPQLSSILESVSKAVDAKIDVERKTRTEKREVKVEAYLANNDSYTNFVQTLAKLPTIQDKQEMMAFLQEEAISKDVWTMLIQNYRRNSPRALEDMVTHLLREKKPDNIHHIDFEIGYLITTGFLLLLDSVAAEENNGLLEIFDDSVELDQVLSQEKNYQALSSVNFLRHSIIALSKDGILDRASLANKLGVKSPALQNYYANQAAKSKSFEDPSKIGARMNTGVITMLEEFSPANMASYDVFLMTSLINGDIVRYISASGNKDLISKVKVKYENATSLNPEGSNAIDILQSFEDFSLGEKSVNEYAFPLEQKADFDAQRKVIAQKALSYLQNQLPNLSRAQMRYTVSKILITEDQELVNSFRKFLSENVDSFGEKVIDLITVLIDLNAFAKDSEAYKYLELEDVIFTIINKLKLSDFTEGLQNIVSKDVIERLIQYLISNQDPEILAGILKVDSGRIVAYQEALINSSSFVTGLKNAQLMTPVSNYLRNSLYQYKAQKIPALIVEMNNSSEWAKIVTSQLFKDHFETIFDKLLELNPEELGNWLKLVSQLVEKISSDTSADSIQIILENLDILVAVDPSQIEKSINIIKLMELDELPELQRVRSQALAMILMHDNPEEAYENIKRVFIDYKTPMFTKLFKVFELMHPPKVLAEKLNALETLSPVLRRIAKAKFTEGTTALDNPLGPRYNLIKSILYSDLVIAQIESGNAELLEFIEQISASMPVLEAIEQDLTVDLEKTRVVFTQIATLFRLDMNIESSSSPKELMDRLKSELGIRPTVSIKQYIQESLLLPSGYSDLAALIAYMGSVKQKAGERNRKLLKEKQSFGKRERRIELSENMLLKSVHSQYLDFLFEYGLLAREFLGASADSDRTPVDWDASRVIKRRGKNLADSNRQSIEASPSFDEEKGEVRFGDVILIIDMADNFQDTTGKADAVYSRTKKEIFTTGVWGEQHVGGRGALGSTHIVGMIVPKKTREDATKLEDLKYKIALFGLDIPILDETLSDANERGEAYFSHEEFLKMRESLSNFDEIQLEKISGDSSAKEVISALSANPFIREQYASDSGVREGYLLGAHTETVINDLDEYFPNTVPTLMNRGEFKIMLGLHDIAKAVSLKLTGSTASQHKFNNQIVKKILRGSNIDERKASLITDIVSQDTIGKYFQGTITLEKAAMRIRLLAARYSIDSAALLSDLLLYFSCDAGAYTASTGGQASLERIFSTRSDGSVDLSQLSDIHQELYSRLKSEVAAPKIKVASLPLKAAPEEIEREAGNVELVAA